MESVQYFSDLSVLDFFVCLFFLHMNQSAFEILFFFKFCSILLVSVKGFSLQIYKLCRSILIVDRIF